MTAKDISDNGKLAVALVIIFSAFGTIAWFGGKTVDTKMGEVQANTEFRITETQRRQSFEKRLERIEQKMDSIPEINKNVAVIAKQIEQWENANK